MSSPGRQSDRHSRGSYPDPRRADWGRPWQTVGSRGPAYDYDGLSCLHTAGWHSVPPHEGDDLEADGGTVRSAEELPAGRIVTWQ